MILGLQPMSNTTFHGVAMHSHLGMLIIVAGAISACVPQRPVPATTPVTVGPGGPPSVTERCGRYALEVYERTMAAGPPGNATAIRASLDAQKATRECVSSPPGPGATPGERCAWEGMEAERRHIAANPNSTVVEAARVRFSTIRGCMGFRR